MKKLFKGYYRLDKKEFETLWENATVIFDTNILLNLYRYQTSTRDSLFKIMEDLAERIWIPYHVGLEYQRNRLTVIAEQRKRFAEVRRIINSAVNEMEKNLESLQLKERHSHINPDKFLKSLAENKEEFIKELESLEDKSISVNSDDNIREKIDNLFKNKIGSPPKNQEELNKLISDGDQRYNYTIPPGFNDTKKENKKSGGFQYAGLIYQKMYGDLIIWKQIIQHAKNNSVKDVILVTDDNKSDWWWIIDKKTMGPRPELIDEIIREAGVERFYIYNPEGFLNYAKQHLDAEVTDAAIKEVREVSDEQTDAFMESKLEESAVLAVYRSLYEKFDQVNINVGFPDITAYNDEYRYGFDIIAGRSVQKIMKRLKQQLYRSYFAVNENEFHEFTVILLALNYEIVEDLIKAVKRQIPEINSNIRIEVGNAVYNSDFSRVIDYIPYDNFNIKNKGSD